MTIITFQKPGPSRAMTVRMRKKVGKVIMMSTKRMRTASTHPPKYPAKLPIRRPMLMAMATETKPTVSEIHDPWSMRLRTSLPSGSVPRRWVWEGGRSFRVRSMALGS